VYTAVHGNQVTSHLSVNSKLQHQIHLDHHVIN